MEKSRKSNHFEFGSDLKKKIFNLPAKISFLTEDRPSSFQPKRNSFLQVSFLSKKFKPSQLDKLAKDERAEVRPSQFKTSCSLANMPQGKNLASRLLLLDACLKRTSLSIEVTSLYSKEYQKKGRRAQIRTQLFTEDFIDSEIIEIPSRPLQDPRKQV